MITVEERLRSAAVALDDAIAVRRSTEASPIEMSVHPPSTRHRRRTVVLAAAAALVFALVGVLVATRDRTERPASIIEVDNEWTKLPAAPLRGRLDAVVVDTSEGLVVWACCSESDRNEGALLRASTGVWDPIPPGPFEIPTVAVGLWTGSEVLVIGGPYSGTTSGLRSAAFDPKSFSWRQTAASPGFVIDPVIGRLSDGRIVFAADVGDVGWLSSKSIAVYDVEADRFTTVEPPERVRRVATTRDFEIARLAVGDDHIGALVTGGDCAAAFDVLDPDGGSWTTIELPISGWEPAIVASVGDRFLLAGGHACDDSSLDEAPEVRRAVLVDPVSGTVVEAAPVPTGTWSSPIGQPTAWNGSLLAHLSVEGRPLFYDPAADRWHAGPSLFDFEQFPPIESPRYVADVSLGWMGDALVVPGALIGPDGQASLDWAYRPRFGDDG